MSLSALLRLNVDVAGSAPPPPPSSTVDLRLALVARLADDAATVALVGDRIFPGGIPEGESLPAIGYRVIASVNGRTLGGPDGSRVSRVQFNCRSRDKLECIDVAAALDGALDGWNDPDATYGVVVQWCHQVSELDFDDWERDGTDDQGHTIAIDYRLRHTKAPAPATGTVPPPATPQPTPGVSGGGFGLGGFGLGGFGL